MFGLDFPSEKFIEDYVAHHMEACGVCPIDETEMHSFVRQHEIKGYGRTDLIKFRRSPGLLEVVILELKNEPLNEIHLSQLDRYMVGAGRQAERYRARFPDYEITIKGQLAGPFDSGANGLVWLLDVIEDIEIYKLSLSMDSGFVATEIPSGWFQKGEDLKGAKPIAKKIGQDIITFESAVAAFEAQEQEEEVE